MSEILRNSSKELYLDVFGGTADDTPTATITANGNEYPLTVTSEPAPEGVDQRFAAIVGMQFTQNDGPVEVVWEFAIDGVEVVKEDYMEVVTPYLTVSEVKAIVRGIDNDQAHMLEAAVRHTIDVLCGQDFGRFTGEKIVRGGDDNVLHLPTRLLSLETVNGVSATDYFTIENGGYALKHYPWGVPPVKADYYGLHQHRGGVIHNPNSVRLEDFYKNATYIINGTWGWPSVPEDIKQAARVLVSDYSSIDAEYRERYLTSMTAADWRIQFHPGAFSSTGNVRADQLIKPYIVSFNWVVI